MQRNINITIEKKNNGQRFDQAVTNILPELSRSRIQKWIKNGELKLNNKETATKTKVFLGDKITGIIEEKLEIENKPQNININIIYKDNDVIVINKKSGLVVHPGAGNHDNTLLNALIYHFPELQNIPRAGIVHRLDKDTSGIMVIARNIESQYNLVKQLQNRTVKRCYVALVLGEIISGGTIRTNIGRSGKDRIRMSVVANGKDAITHYKIIKKHKGLTLLECRLETGRTHQIRVHLSHIRYPLVGDPLYGGRNKIPKKLSNEIKELIRSFPRQALHALKLEFIHPRTGKNVFFESKIEKDIQNLITKISNIK